jgi:hypothetical protein
MFGGHGQPQARAVGSGEAFGGRRLRLGWEVDGHCDPEAEDGSREMDVVIR